MILFFTVYDPLIELCIDRTYFNSDSPYVKRINLNLIQNELTS